MSDDMTVPGAPKAKGVDEAVERVASKDVSTPDSLVSAAKQIDAIILRLNRLLASPGGLSAFLSTFTYTAYIAAYIQTKSPQLSALARRLLSLASPSASSKPPTTTLVADGAVPPLAALAGLISRARTTLRLFGLFPLYAWLRTLLAGPKPGADPVLHRIALTQCLSYFTYQALENVSVLADNAIIPKRIISIINRGRPTTARLYLWAYRAWLGGISCDFVRLAREAQLHNQHKASRKAVRESEGKSAYEYEEEDKRFDAKWWTDLTIASMWLPMALHFSSVTGGLPGWNMGWMGLCGLVAGSSRMRALWAGTLDP